MKKIPLHEFGNIAEDFKELAQQILDDEVSVEFQIDFSGCYYEGDTPSYDLLIKDKNE